MRSYSFGLFKNILIHPYNKPKSSIDYSFIISIVIDQLVQRTIVHNKTHWC